ncbi:Protein of unknown function [Amphibacillus marinus]|uniref:Endospore appendages core domain-containing protein n=1 Tax=Amphibacillus marinus TaxID=872970 RepID=A0A1H8Q514_9BACI|nr:S-Ena type endospore appendage [Amphibacillus marinus]SEO49007.1 Protein of unknown function [Amphibacillus marinus]
MANTERDLLGNHCLNVMQIYDWITHCSNHKVKIPVFQKNKAKINKQDICGDFHMKDGSLTPILLWHNASSSYLTGTISITNYLESRGSVNVYVNHKHLLSISRGTSKSVTVDNLQSVSISTTSKAISQGRYMITLNEKIILNNTKLFELENVNQMECFLTDKNGKRIDPNKLNEISCKEITPKNKRARKIIKLADGKHASLERVIVQITGYVSLKNYKFNCCLGPVPFCYQAVYFLCAPTGTSISAIVESFSCEMSFVPSSDNCVCFYIEMNCASRLNIKSFTHSNIAVTGKVIKPRELLRC